MFKSPLSVEQISAAINGTIVGPHEIQLTDVKTLEAATATDLSFFAPTTKRGFGELQLKAKASAAGCLLTKEPVDGFRGSQIISENPLLGLIELLNSQFQMPQLPKGIAANTVIGDASIIDDSAAVGPFCCIGENVTIGARTKIFPQVVIYSGAKIGTNCIIHSGAVIRENVIIEDGCIVQNGAIIGGDGFGYLPHPSLGLVKIPHVGGVVLSKAVEVGANSTIDRGMLGDTQIGSMTKVDNLVMIGHNVKIGSASILCGQVGISGSSEVGSQSVLGGQVGVADHVKIASRVRIGAKSGISGDIDEPGDYAGYPHSTGSSWKRTVSMLRRLPEMYKEVREIRRELAALKVSLKKD